MFLSDDNDDDLDYDDDDNLIQTLRQAAVNDDFDWDAIADGLSQKMDTTFFASEKFDYLMTAIMASGMDDQCVAITLPHMVDLCADLYDTSDKVKCANIIARHAENTDWIELALQTLEASYQHDVSQSNKLDALSVLLNDPRPICDPSARAAQHMIYFHEWSQIIANSDAKTQAESAYDVLIKGEAYNAFKPDLVKTIFDNVMAVNDPVKQIDMILLCNRVDPDEDNKPIYLNHIDTGYIPKLHNYNWQPHFYNAALQGMHQVGDTVDIISYIKQQIHGFCLDEWVGDACETVDHIIKNFDFLDFKKRHTQSCQVTEPLDFNPRCAADLLRRPGPYLEWAAHFHDNMYEDDSETDDPSVCNPKEVACYRQLSSAYERIKTKIKGSRRTDTDSQIRYCEFKADFLAAVCTGDAVPDVIGDYDFFDDEIGLWSTAIAYANQQQAYNQLAYDYLVNEANIARQQQQVTADQHRDPACFNIVTDKGNDPSAVARGEQDITTVWAVKNGAGMEPKGILNLTLRPN